MSDDAHTPHLIRFAALRDARSVPFSLIPGAEARAALAERLGLIALRKLRFEGELVPEGKRDWRLEAKLGATVVQPCVVTLEPVTTRIDEEITRRYLADLPAQPEGEEVEMPEDETLEPLPEALNLEEVMAEALALALPLYPRAEGAELGEAVFTEPGQRPMTDEDTKPLAGLAELLKKQKRE
ncbi:MAG: YceD family protein [Paracoccaceae bacterium]